jgi:Signal transduction histidine kinase regulating phosphoglycerate transport system
MGEHRCQCKDPNCVCFWKGHSERVVAELKRLGGRYTKNDFALWFKSVTSSEMNWHSSMTLDNYENDPEMVVRTFLVAQEDGRIKEAMKLVEQELRRAITKHPKSFNSHHEGFAVLLEEVEEYKAEVFKGGSVERDRAALSTELVQTAAMAARALVDLCL